MNGISWQSYIDKHIKPRHGYIYDDDMANFYKNGVRLLNSLWNECCDPKGKSIIDIGCGMGRLPIAIDGEKIEIDFYTGVDIQKVSVDFCNKAFENNDKFWFHHLDIRNYRYAPKQVLSVADVKLDFPQHDILIANSVFTHTGNFNDAKIYLEKLLPLIKDDGLLYISWLRSPPHELSNDTKRSVYLESDILQLYNDCNLEIIRTFGGISTTSVGNQWRIVAKKK